jgi:hypothetical protein
MKENDLSQEGLSLALHEIMKHNNPDLLIQAIGHDSWMYHMKLAHEAAMTGKLTIVAHTLPRLRNGVMSFGQAAVALHIIFHRMYAMAAKHRNLDIMKLLESDVQRHGGTLDKIYALECAIKIGDAAIVEHVLGLMDFSTWTLQQHTKVAVLTYATTFGIKNATAVRELLAAHNLVPSQDTRVYFEAIDAGKTSAMDIAFARLESYLVSFEMGYALMYGIYVALSKDRLYIVDHIVGRHAGHRLSNEHILGVAIQSSSIATFIRLIYKGINGALFSQTTLITISVRHQNNQMCPMTTTLFTHLLVLAATVEPNGHEPSVKSLFEEKARLIPVRTKRAFHRVHDIALSQGLAELVRRLDDWKPQLGIE